MPTACDGNAKMTASFEANSCPPLLSAASEAGSPPGLLAPPGLEGISSSMFLGSLIQPYTDNSKDTSLGLIQPKKVIQSQDDGFSCQAQGEDDLTKFKLDLTETKLDLTDDSIKAELKDLLEKISSELDKVSEDFASTAASTPEDGLTPVFSPEAESPAYPAISKGVIGPEVGKGAFGKSKVKFLSEGKEMEIKDLFKELEMKDLFKGSEMKDLFAANPIEVEAKELFTADPFTGPAAYDDSFGLASETLDKTTSPVPKRRGRANGLGIAIVFGARGSELAEKTYALAQANDNSLFFQESTAELDGVPVARLAEEWLQGKDESEYCSDCYTGEEWCPSTEAGSPAMLNPYVESIDEMSPWGYEANFDDFNTDWYSELCEEEGVVVNGREWFSV
jgi:hypothetical protein